MQPTLSILIPTLRHRHDGFSRLYASINEQRSLLNAWQSVEVLFDPRAEDITTGEKRNDLIHRARGKYVWHNDDDDELYPHSLEKILAAAETDCDVMAVNGIITMKTRTVRWFIGLGYEYQAEFWDGEEVYVRFPNHLAPIKREKIKDIKFPHITQQEDYQWALAVRAAGVLKTETVIAEPIYNYIFLK